MEPMMARLAEDQCFSAPRSHHSLPEFLSFCYVFQLPYVMNLKWSLCGFTVFTLPLVHPFDDLRSAERPDIGVRLLVDQWVVGPGWFEVFEAEEFDDASLLFSWDDECIPLIGFQPLDNRVDTRFVFIRKRF